MDFFKADRLKKFLAGRLWNSGVKVEVYMPKGEAVKPTGRKWVLIPQPADALSRMVHVQPPSPVALPQAPGAAGSSAGSGVNAAGCSSAAPRQKEADTSQVQICPPGRPPPPL
jgi:hypothetical protein